MVKGKYHVSKFGCPSESHDGRASHSQNSILPVAGDTLAGHHGLSLTQGTPGHMPPFHPSTAGSLGFSNAAQPPAAPSSPARIQSKGPRIRRLTPPRRKSENLAESTPLTCNEYDTDRPTKPALRLCLEITANRAANRTIQLPTHSRRTASHLPADTQADRQTQRHTETWSQLSRVSGFWFMRAGWGSLCSNSPRVPEKRSQGKDGQRDMALLLPH